MSRGEAAPSIVTDGGGAPGASRGFVWLSVVVFGTLTAALFWRYVVGLTTTVSDPGDPLLLIWVMEWVQRALVSAPLQLFSAPMFHPFADTLAYTDPVVPQAILALPFRALGLGPVAAYNLVYLTGIAATGVLSADLFLRLSGSRSAALFGAAVATFPSIRLFQLAHVALQVTLFWPLVFLLVHAVVRRPTWPRAAGLALALVMATLGSLYYGLFLAILLPPFVIAMWATGGIPSLGALAALGGSCAAAGAALLPVARVYSRAPKHLAQVRGASGFSDLAHYLGISPFSDVSRWLGSQVVKESSPEWVGGGAVLLSFLIAAWLLCRITLQVLSRKRRRVTPRWARIALPYVVTACLAVFLSLGPRLTWHGHVLGPSPFGFLTKVPGASGIRDFQRAGFPAAFASAAVLSVMLGELARRARRAYPVVLALVGVTTVVPAYSSTLPAYVPPPLAPEFEWVRDQPEPFILYEAPLGRRSQLEVLSYLWTSAQHRKRIVHGFSGYLPLTDDVLRDESVRLDRPDYFRALGSLGATHLLVHTAELAALPGGAASLERLREAHAADRVATFEGAEVYRVPPVGEPAPARSAGSPTVPAYSRGGMFEEHPRTAPPGASGCVEIGGSTEPLVLYAPGSERISGLVFVAQSEIGRMDDALSVEGSADFARWTSLDHEPLLSSSLAAYVVRPTPVFWTRADFATDAGSFLRLSGRREFRLRLCGLRVRPSATFATSTLSGDSVRVSANVHQEAADLASDGKLATRWTSGGPQRGSESLRIDLGSPRDVAALVLEQGDSPYDYGRTLSLDCEDPAGPAFELDGRAILFERPRPAQVFPVHPRRACRVLRLRQTGTATDNYWSVAEIAVITEGDAKDRPASDEIGAGH